MREKNSFLNWVGFKGDEPTAPSSVDRIRELESQLADLRSRRDINSLSKEEFEILATETAMAMIKSAQAREAKAQSTTSRLINETTSQVKETLEAADSKAHTILSGAETRGRKYIEAAESEAQEVLALAESEADTLVEVKKREATTLTLAARRESERIVSGATGEVANYRQWLTGVTIEAERLYKIQTQSLNSAEHAIRQSRDRLESAFTQLAELQKNVVENLNADDTIINAGPISVLSERRDKALPAPKKSVSKSTTKKVAKKKPAKK